MHDLTFTEGSEPYHIGTELPTLTGTCGCGQWSRKIHRFDAPEYREYLEAEHRVHAARQGLWPAHGSELHPLLAGTFNGDRTEGEFRSLTVPKTAGGLARGTTYGALIGALSEELLAALDGVVPRDGVPLERAPRLAAAYALMDRLKDNFPEVRAWRVMVVRRSDQRAGALHGPWCFLACHTQEEAERYLPVVLAKLNKGRTDPDGTNPSWFVGSVDQGPTTLGRLRLPGMTPETERLG